MTDLECKKICKALDIKDIWLNTENVVCVKTSIGTIGHVYIYEDDFSYALPLRMLKLPSKVSSPKKNLLELLIRQSEDGIKSAIVFVESSGLLPKTKLIDKNESLESLLVQYDLKFSHKKKKSCKKSRKSVE